MTHKKIKIIIIGASKDARVKAAIEKAEAHSLEVILMTAEEAEEMRPTSVTLETISEPKFIVPQSIHNHRQHNHRQHKHGKQKHWQK